MTSISHLLLLTVNHYLAIAYAATYKRILSNIVVCTAIVCFWLAPPSLYLLLCAVVPGQLFQSEGCGQMIVLQRFGLRFVISMLTLFVPVTVMVVLYVFMFKLLSNMEHQFHGDQRRSKAVERKRKVQVSKQFMLQILLFLFALSRL